MVAGRSASAASAFCQRLQGDFGKPVECLQLDVLTTPLHPVFIQHRPDIVINASGPFQDQLGENHYSVARACISARCHYIDLSDSRQFVVDFSPVLNADAKAAGVMLVTGASTVPGLTSTVIDAFLPDFSKLSHVEYGISPGNRTERGASTISSILSYVGKPFTTFRNGKMHRVYGWQNISRYNFGNPIGTRWMSNCNVPDLELLPERYKDLATVNFKAGLELSILHIGLWVLSAFTRAGLVKSWSPRAKLLTRMSEWFINMGTDCGGMFVSLTGTAKIGGTQKIDWQIIAENGEGPNIPVIAPQLIVNRIATGNTVAGAMPCLGLFTLAEFMEIASRRGIVQRVSRRAGRH